MTLFALMLTYILTNKTANELNACSLSTSLDNDAKGKSKR